VWTGGEVIRMSNDDEWEKAGREADDILRRLKG
jgi:hypothetical protein